MLTIIINPTRAISDVPITSLAYNPWPRDVHLAVGLSSGEIQVYKVAVPDSKPELLASLDQSMVTTNLIKHL